MGFFFFWIIGCIVAALIGQNKTIGATGSFFLSLFLSPIIGIIVALVSQEQVVVDLQKKVIAPTYNNNSSESIAGELQKFKDLLDQGAISEKEYENQKKRLLD